MNYKMGWMIVVLLILAILPLAACSGLQEETIQEEPAKVEAIEGSEFNRVTLTERAAERLDIQTKMAREEAIDGSVKLVIPYSALIYGLNGETWAYMRDPDVDSLTFVRVPLTVERVEGDLVVLADGPEPGTEVVTVGAAELYGADTGVGK